MRSSVSSLWAVVCSGVLVALTGAADAQPAPESVGQIVVMTEPVGAQISVDGRSAGTSPVTVRDLMPGVHLVTAVMPDGRRIDQTVEIEAGRSSLVRFPAGGAAASPPETRPAEPPPVESPPAQPQVQPVEPTSTQHRAASDAPLEADLGDLGDTSWRGSGTGGLRTGGLVVTLIGAACLAVGFGLLAALLDEGDPDPVQYIAPPLLLATGVPLLIVGLVVVGNPAPPEATEAGVRFGSRDAADFRVARGLRLRLAF